MEVTSDWINAEKAVAAFNTANQWVKQGHCIVPMKFNCDLGKGFHAVVTAHSDGSVLVAHGGCDIGQGISIKTAQVAALSLSVDLSLVTVDATTSKVSSGE